MSAMPGWTEEGVAATEVILGIFQANGRLMASGDALAAPDGLTAARWQVLGAVVLAGRPITVPQIARRMGLTRQSVQVSVRRLLDEGLLETSDNPDHRRSALLGLTALGRDRYRRVERRQVKWVNQLAMGLDASDLATAAAILQAFAGRLDGST